MFVTLLLAHYDTIRMYVYTPITMLLTLTQDDMIASINFVLKYVKYRVQSQFSYLGKGHRFFANFILPRKRSN